MLVMRFASISRVVARRMRMRVVDFCLLIGAIANSMGIIETVSISSALVTISMWNSSSVVDEVDITEVAVVVVGTVVVAVVTGVT